MGYMKGGEWHRYDLEKDKAHKAKRIRKPGEPRWKGDLAGERY
jgi:hypothetical protein